MKHYEVRITCDCCGVEAIQSNGFTKPSAADEHAIQMCEAAGWYYSEHCWTCTKCENQNESSSKVGGSSRGNEPVAPTQQRNAVDQRLCVRVAAFQEGLQRQIDFWRTNQNDPHGIGNSVLGALYAVMESTKATGATL